MPEIVPFDDEQWKIIQSYRQSEAKLKDRIAELTEQANAAYAPYRERVLAARDEVNKVTAERDALKCQLYDISSLISERHGSDPRYDDPESDYYDSAETITIKRIFAILDSGHAKN